MFIKRNPIGRCTLAIAVLLFVESTLTAGIVRHVKFTSDGKSVLVAYSNGKQNGAIVLWDVATREPRWIHRNQESGFTRVAVDRENQWIAVGGYAAKVRVLEFATGRVLHDLQGHEGEARAVEFTGRRGDYFGRQRRNDSFLGPILRKNSYAKLRGIREMSITWRFRLTSSSYFRPAETREPLKSGTFVRGSCCTLSIGWDLSFLKQLFLGRESGCSSAAGRDRWSPSKPKAFARSHSSRVWGAFIGSANRPTSAGW